jgi:hypothetical protein
LVQKVSQWILARMSMAQLDLASSLPLAVVLALESASLREQAPQVPLLAERAALVQEQTRQVWA